MTSTAERKCEELALLGNHVAIYGAEQQTKEECRQRQPDQETQVRGYFSEKKMFSFLHVEGEEGNEEDEGTIKVSYE